MKVAGHRRASGKKSSKADDYKGDIVLLISVNAAR
jgi:hypothetical protein